MEEKKRLTAEERIELKERLKKEIDELSDEELDTIAGGLIVQGNGLENHLVIDDKTGEILQSFFYMRDAKGYAEYKGVSTEIISREEYERKFGK